MQEQQLRVPLKKDVLKALNISIPEVKKLYTLKQNKPNSRGKVCILTLLPPQVIFFVKISTFSVKKENAIPRDINHF